MNSMPAIQKSVDEAMDSLKNIQPALPKPFFYTRLHARMIRVEISTWEKAGRLITHPAIAVVAVSLVLILNALVIFQHMSSTDEVPGYSEMAASEDLRAISNYDLENIQP